MPLDDISISPFRPDDAAGGHALTQELRWPHRLEDWQHVATLGEGLAARDASGRIVGSALWWPYGRTVATIGHILVAGDHRGRGLGRLLTERVLAATSERALKLQATLDGLPLYRRLGFAVVDEICQHQGVVARATDRAVPGRAARLDDLPALTALDAAAFGASRETLIASIAERGSTWIIDENGTPAAFAVRRAFGRGEVIGPIVARDEDEAIALVDALVRPGFVRADIPRRATRLSATLTAHGMVEVDRATTMTKGEWPTPNGAVRMFGLVSQSLG